jgi:hypothetical protein
LNAKPERADRLSDIEDQIGTIARGKSVNQPDADIDPMEAAGAPVPDRPLSDLSADVLNELGFHEYGGPITKHAGIARQVRLECSKRCSSALLTRFE